MANRILRDWTGSKKIQKCSPLAERFFTRLIMKVDDFGCYPADPVFLKSTLFPLIENLASPEVTDWLIECRMHGLIQIYTVAEEQFLQIVDFKQRLRQAKGKYPLPVDGQLSDNGRLETKRNEEETEEETKAACDLKELDAELVSIATDFTEGLCSFFSVKTIVLSPKYNKVCDFVSTVANRDQLTEAVNLFDKYKAYKARSQETVHAVESWIGTKENHYQDGHWITTDWIDKDKNHRTNDRKSNQTKVNGTGSIIDPGKSFGKLRPDRTG
jgi:hypothetical protein